MRPADRRRLPRTGETFGSLLCDGFVGGIWKLARAGGETILRLVPFARPSSSLRAELVGEGERLLAFAGHERGRVEIASHL